MTHLFKKIWSKSQTDNKVTKGPQSKDKNYFNIEFLNYENPERSFSINSNNPQNVYFTGKGDENHPPVCKNSQTTIIFKPKQKQNSSSSEESVINTSTNSKELSKPAIFTWQNKDAYIYKLDTKYFNENERPDLEFVIYIPIDTAVKWLKNSKSRENGLSPKKEIKVGTEENVHPNQTAQTWNNKSDDEEKKVKTDPKPDKIKENKVKPLKKTTKTARRIVTTYEEDEDEISLGRLRPLESQKKPVQIVEKDKLNY